MGTCEFVVRLLARVTGEKRGARYVWHKMLVGTVPEKKKYVEGKRFPADLEKNSVFELWFVDGCFFNKKQHGRCDVKEDTALKRVAPRMSCAVLAAAAW